MGEALLRGLMTSGWAQQHELAVVEALPARRAELSQLYPQLEVRQEPLDGVDALLAVKPNDVTEVAKSLDAPRVLSIAAGVRLARLEELLPKGCRGLRAMPNTPALLGEGAAAVAAGSVASEQDLNWAVGILESVGTVVVVEEKLLDAVTGVSGSGPAYLFLVAEAMISAAIEVGLSPEVADALVRQTLLGSAKLLAEGTETPERLRKNVTSPGGTTAAALEVFEAMQLREIFSQAIQVATDRSKELGA